MQVLLLLYNKANNAFVLSKRIISPSLIETAGIRRNKILSATFSPLNTTQVYVAVECDDGAQIIDSNHQFAIFCSETERSNYQQLMTKKRIVPFRR